MNLVFSPPCAAELALAALPKIAVLVMRRKRRTEN